MNFQTIVRGMTTNHAELSDDADDLRMRPIYRDEPPRQVADRIVDWIGGQSRWDLVDRSDDEIAGAIALHLIHTSFLFRFVDDVRVRVSIDDANVNGGGPGGSRIDAASQSRVGKGDLGQNARNLRELVAGLRVSV